jgi:cyclophilin family peptidyl-prolyl cis-trans isomerase
MRRTWFVLAGFVALSIASPVARSAFQATKAPAAAPAKPAAAAAGPVLVLGTTKGDIEITLDGDAPKSIAHILDLAKTTFYRGQRFHWVEAGVVQVGDPNTRDMTKQEQWGLGGSGPGNANKPIGAAEPSKKPFLRGTVGLAYLKDRKPESADSQFFIMRFGNPALNGKYAMLGHVTKGLDVLDKIERGDVLRQVTVK